MNDSLPRHSVSVAAAILNASADAVLLIRRRDNGHWEPPGGVLELEETPEEGVRREVAEETGARIQVERLSGVYKNMERGIIALVFRCHMTGDHVAHQTPEAVDVEWCGVDDLETLMAPAYAIRVKDALTTSVEVKVRSHDGKSTVGEG